MLRIRFQYPTGSTLGYSLERLADGTFYDNSTSTFVAVPVTPIVPLPEDTGIYVGRYKVTLTATPIVQFHDGNYTVTIHDRANSNHVVGELGTRMFNGDDCMSYGLGNIGTIVRL